MEYVVEKTFEKIDFTTKNVPKGEYETCRFVNCNWADADLSEFKFIDCVFVGCNLSNAKLNNTALQNVIFEYCKLLGLPFENCDDFLLACSFDNCVLNHASFYKKKLTKSHFKNCQLHEVDFTESNLSESIFDACDLSRSIFSNSNLEKVNFETAFNYSIDPTTNRVKKAIFSCAGLPGLLAQFDIIIKQ